MDHQLPDTPPDMTGQHGAAWRVNLAAVIAKYPAGPPMELTPCAWVVHAPYAHPIWHSYAIACVALRHHERAPVPRICLEGATHQIMVWALDPEHPVTVDDRPRLLTPLNFGAQFIAESDVAAVKRIDETVRDVIEANLNPDTDAVQQWFARFGDNMVRRDERSELTIHGIDGKPGLTIVVIPLGGDDDEDKGE